MGEHPSPETLHRMFVEADTDRSGTIDLAEFLAASVALSLSLTLTLALSLSLSLTLTLALALALTLPRYSCTRVTTRSVWRACAAG